MKISRDDMLGFCGDFVTAKGLIFYVNLSWQHLGGRVNIKWTTH